MIFSCLSDSIVSVSQSSICWSEDGILLLDITVKSWVRGFWGLPTILRSNYTILESKIALKCDYRTQMEVPQDDKVDLILGNTLHTCS